MSVVDQETVDALRDMGFDESTIKKAMERTGTTDLATIIEAIEEMTKEESVVDTPVAQNAGATSAPASDTTENAVADDSKDGGGKDTTNDAQPDHNVAADGKDGDDPDSQSVSFLKCNECGAVFGRMGAARHAESTGHCEYSEATAEDRRIALLAMKERAAAKQRKEELDREKLRRLEGRKMGNLRSEMRQLELQRLAEERKREKKLDQLRRQQIRDQIKADREAVRERQAPAVASVKKPAEAAAPVMPAPVRDSDDCRIMVRLSDGRCMNHTFKRTEPLSAVRVWVMLNHPDGVRADATLAQVIPRKLFSDDEMQMSLKDLQIGSSCTFILR